LMSPSERTLLFPNPHCLSYEVIARLSVLTCLTIGRQLLSTRVRADCSSYRVGRGTPVRAEEFRCLGVQRSPDLSRLFVSTSNSRTSLMALKCCSADAKPERLSTFAANFLALALRLLSQENLEAAPPSPESDKHESIAVLVWLRGASPRAPHPRMRHSSHKKYG
jgi:hypothetical protein